MFCKTHPLTELRHVFCGFQEVGEETAQVFGLYCPVCGRDRGEKMVFPDRTEERTID